MSRTSPDVRCPRCGAEVFRFGRDPNSGFQRYRCKNAACRRQFVPERPPRPRKYPKVICPKCGSDMGIFKHLSDALRFRCNRYRAKGDRRCTHKVNVPLPGKESFDSVLKPSQIRLIEGKIQPVFHWNRMKFSPATVAIALYFSFFRAMPAPGVVETLRDLYQIKVSHDTITRWRHKAAFLLAEKCAELTVIPKKPGRKPRILADETQFKSDGNKRWLWLTYVPRYDAYLGHNLSARRDTQAARDTFAMTYHHSPHMKQAEVLTDGLWSYIGALDDLGVDSDRHLVYRSFFEEPNNNRLERKWSNFKCRARPFRGFKSDVGLAAFVESQIVYHNFFKPSPRLGGKTPAQELGVRLPDAPSDWARFLHLLTS
jgi:transposase-like protein/DNA-directed RNA polymerase subunit RPC12/RpoP